MFGMASCVEPFADAGKSCGDESDCEGICVAPPGAEVGDHVSGACHADTASLFGCFDVIETGIVVGGMCFV